MKMKKFLCILSIAALTLMSCSDLTDSYDDGGYSDVYAGILIFDVASATNTLALDGAGVALRLAMILEEMESQGIEVVEGSEQSWDELSDFEFGYNSTDYNLKEFLFGDEEQLVITKSGDEYEIAYCGPSSTNYYGRALFDSYYRNGSYLVDTKGLSLDETDSENAWEVSLSGSDMNYGSISSAEDYAIASSIAVSVWYQGEGCFVMENALFEASYAALTSVTTDWYSKAELTISDYVSLESDDLDDVTFSYNIITGTGGTALSGLTMTYSTGGNLFSEDPLTYKPSEAAYTTISGTEEIELTGTYSETLYPSPYVSIEWYMGYVTVSYNECTYSTL